MENIIRRNKTMFKLSILAIVVYVSLTVISMISPAFFDDVYKLVNFRLIISNFIPLALLIGYIAVYVLWTPDSKGIERKRPTLPFVLLIISIFVPKVISNIITYTQINMSSWDIFDFFSNANKSQMLTFLRRIIYYSFVILKTATLILLFIRSERRAKKIFIIYMISTLLSVVSAIIYPCYNYYQ